MVKRRGEASMDDDLNTGPGTMNQPPAAWRKRHSFGSYLDPQDPISSGKIAAKLGGLSEEEYNAEVYRLYRDREYLGAGPAEIAAVAIERAKKAAQEAREKEKQARYEQGKGDSLAGLIESLYGPQGALPAFKATHITPGPPPGLGRSPLANPGYVTPAVLEAGFKRVIEQFENHMRDLAERLLDTTELAARAIKENQELREQIAGLEHDVNQMIIEREYGPHRDIRCPVPVMVDHHGVPAVAHENDVIPLENLDKEYVEKFCGRWHDGSITDRLAMVEEARAKTRGDH